MAVKVAGVCPASPSVTATSSIETVGGSSSLLIVPTPWLSAIELFAELLVRLTLNVSSTSSLVSPLTLTVTVSEVSPGAKVTVPELAS